MTLIGTIATRRWLPSTCVRTRATHPGVANHGIILAILEHSPGDLEPRRINQIAQEQDAAENPQRLQQRNYDGFWTLRADGESVLLVAPVFRTQRAQHAFIGAVLMAWAGTKIRMWYG